MCNAREDIIQRHPIRFAEEVSRPVREPVVKSMYIEWQALIIYTDDNDSK